MESSISSMLWSVLIGLLKLVICKLNLSLDGAACYKQQRRLYVSCRSRFFFSFLMRLLSNGWTDFHQIFTKRRLLFPQKVSGAQNVHFLAKIETSPFSGSHCSRRNSGKTKTTGITTVSKLLSHPHQLA